MGEVFLGRTWLAGGIEKRVAIKRILPSFAVDEEFAEMFLQEARLAAVLEHPNIVHVSEVERDANDLFMVMTYLEGGTLAQMLSRYRRSNDVFSVGFAVHVLLGVLEGLAYAHERCDYDGRALNIVHRDVTPQNIFVTLDGGVKLLDFGIAKAATSRVITTVGHRKGKVGYMAPEQELGLAVDLRADVFAAGVVLYELLAGERPYRAISTHSGAPTRRPSGPPSAISEQREDVPVELDEVLRRALARDAGQRFQDAAAFRSELAKVAAAHGLRVGNELAGKTVRAVFGSPSWPGRSIPEVPAFDQASRQLSSTPGGGAESSADPEDGVPIRAGDPKTEPRGVVGSSPGVAEASSSGPDSRPAPAPRSWTWVGWAAVLVGGVGVAAWFLASAGEESRGERTPGARVVDTESGSARAAWNGVSPQKLARLLDESDVERALGYRERHEVLRELSTRTGGLSSVDTENQTTLDLFQVDQAPRPCETLGAILDNVTKAPRRRYLPGLVHASRWLATRPEPTCVAMRQPLEDAILSATNARGRIDPP